MILRQVIYIHDQAKNEFSNIHSTQDIQNLPNRNFWISIKRQELSSAKCLLKFTAKSKTGWKQKEKLMGGDKTLRETQRGNSRSRLTTCTKEDIIRPHKTPSEWRVP